MEKANTNLIKEINLNLVRKVLKQINKTTKPQLAALTDLSVVTINTLMQELLNNGEIFEDEIVPSNGGRHALTYRFNYEYSLALIIHINEKQGTDVVNTTVVNLNEDVLMKEEHPFQIFNATQFYSTIQDIISHYPSIKVIGIGIPGQTVNGEITVSSHERLNGIRLAEDVQSKFGLPVIVENDVNAAVCGYVYREQIDEDQCVLAIYFPENSPPGMGIYLRNGVLKGKHGLAGEIKFIPSIVWDESKGTEVFFNSICEIIRILQSVFDPDRIVIYRENIEEVSFFHFLESYKSKHKMPLYPDVILSDLFYEDFKTGLRGLTLKELERPIIVFK
ncbi:ROK family protein [Paenibacillus polymyxa]|uniref:ROK family protein n=1 Tax=Paenibacillus polymyxa TaxID=1406 RepID=UPI0032AE9B3E